MTIRNVPGNFLTRRANGFPNNMAPAQVIPSIGVGIDDYWGIKCVEGHWVPRNQEIPNCPENHRLAEELFILPEDIELITQPARTLERSWFHVSDRPWTNPDLTKFSHIGPREAALMRGRNPLLKDAEVLYLHEFELDRNATVADEIFLESDGFRVELLYELEISDPDTSSIYRYVNREEAPGLVSLVVKPAALILVNEPQRIK